MKELDHTAPRTGMGPDGELRRVRTRDDWDRRRRGILDAFATVMGELPPAGGAVTVHVRGETRADGYLRRSLYFEAVPGHGVPAYLLLPLGAAMPAPAVLCLHQTTAVGKDEPAGLGGKPGLHYAHELAQRGFVCLVPDYPSFGEYPYDFSASPYPSGVLTAVRNNRRGVDLLQSLEEVDPARIGCIGHSLGGHTSIFTAMHDDRIRAAVSSCGFSSCETEQRRGALAAWSQERYMPRVAAYKDMRRLPFDFHELVAALAPRAFLAVSPVHDTNFDAAGAQEVVEAAREVYELLGAAERIEIRSPETAHEFPAEEREYAYGFLETWLG